jgi:hypothetical protein
MSGRRVFVGDGESRRPVPALAHRERTVDAAPTVGPLALSLAVVATPAPTGAPRFVPENAESGLANAGLRRCAGETGENP